MSERPVVSAVIPAFNASRFLAESIESVLAQTYPAIECIVVDDGSEDRSLDIARGFEDRIRVIAQSNAGVSAARNRGAREARGEFVAFLDADDLWAPEKIERQVDAFEASPGLCLVYTGLRVIDEAGAEQGYLPAPPPERALANTLLLEGPGISVAQTGMIRMNVFRAIGGFDEFLSTSADADLACRLALEGPISHLDQPLVSYRRHSDQMHLDPTATERDMMRVHIKLFDDPRLPPDVARGRRRAEANLFTILAASSVLNRRVGLGCRYLLKALRRGPTRPLQLAAKRLVRPLRSTRASASNREDWLSDSATHAGWEKAYRTPDTAAFFELAFDWVGSRFTPCEQVLDVGCGTGAHAIRLARRGLRVAGVDLSEVALQVGSQKIAAAGLQGSVATSRQDVLGLALSQGAVGCVLCWGVLMHVPDLEGAITELRRVMKKGGVLVLSEVNARSVESILIRTVNRLKDRRRVRKTEVGFELLRTEDTAAAFTRHCDIPGLVELVETRGFRLDTRRAGQLTELYTRVSSRRVRLALGRLNVWWFGRGGTPAIAVGNILVFRAD